MNTIEQCIFENHMKSLNTKWEEFSKEIKDMQSLETFSILWATDVHYIRKYAQYIPA